MNEVERVAYVVRLLVEAVNVLESHPNREVLQRTLATVRRAKMSVEVDLAGMGDFSRQMRESAPDEPKEWQVAVGMRTTTSTTSR